jgi:hypothetical protein
MAESPAFSISCPVDGLGRSRLTLNSFSTTKPSFGHAIPSGFILQADRNMCHPSAFVGVSAEFLCGVHGCSPLLKGSTMNHVSGSLQTRPLASKLANALPA